MNTIVGIHHITAIAGDAQQNFDFYTGVLGLRLVKVTVNFDDPENYHLYYGDGQGHPGTILTFFVWPGARRGSQGNSQVTATAFAIPPGSMSFWRDRLAANQVVFENSLERFGEQVLPFYDGDGLRLELIETANADASRTWTGSSVPAEAAIRGLHSGVLSEADDERTATLLTQSMGFRLVGKEQNRFRYEADQGGAGKMIDVIAARSIPRGNVAVGTVHHIAFRTPDDEQQHAWLAELQQLGFAVSPVRDRMYFHSIYFREPGGILFEIATDPPGFAVDEPIEKLGTELKLPPWLESERSKIEASLQPLQRHEAQTGVSS